MRGKLFFFRLEEQAMDFGQWYSNRLLLQEGHC